MNKFRLLIAVPMIVFAGQARAAEFRFDFTGTVLAETRPNLTVTPQPITGFVRYTAPAGGNIVTTSGSADLFTSLYGPFLFSEYTATLTNALFTFSANQPNGQGFSLRASAISGGGYGFVNAGDGFSLTGTPVNATGRLTGSFAPAASAVPEPASWLLMLGGVGALGGVLRARRAGLRKSGVVPMAS